MLDINLIRNNPDQVKAAMIKKHRDPEIVDQLLAVDRDRRILQKNLEDHQAQLNQLSLDIPKYHGQQKLNLIERANPVSAKVKELKPEFEKINEEWMNLMLSIPNLVANDVPDGESEDDNVEIRQWGEKPKFDFQPKTHEELNHTLKLFNFDQGAKVAGNKFYYLTGDVVILEMALIRYAMDQMKKKGFEPLAVPDLVRKEALYGTGHFPPEEDAYHVMPEDLWLIATAEIGILSYHAEQTLMEWELPKRYVGYSTCFRPEAGAYGKETRGLYRLHQFNKVEMFSFTRPEDAEKEHEFLIKCSEEILQNFGLHYRVVNCCGGDLGLPHYKRFDIETWMPGLDKYGETHSGTNATDFQARRLRIKYRRSGEEHKTDYVYTLNNTVLASPRILIPILEQFQQKDGSVRIPEALHPYTGFAELRRQ